MSLPGAIGYVVINFDGKSKMKPPHLSLIHFVTPNFVSIGIPVKYFPEDDEKMKAVQYSALISNLVM